MDLKWFLLLILLIFSSGCSLEKNNSEIIIVSLGDSITYGYEVNKTQNYPYLLEKKLREKGYNITVINLGINGETSFETLNRLNKVLEFNPDILILEIGVNDISTLNLSETKNNIKKIISFFLEREIKVILFQMNSIVDGDEEYNHDFNLIYEEISNLYEIILIEDSMVEIFNNPKFTIEKDFIHPNYLGYKFLVEEKVYPKVKMVLDSNEFLN